MSKGSCSFCGEHFDNVFEAVDHLDEEFSPKFIVSEHVKLDISDLLYMVYERGDAEAKKEVEELFSALYIAEKRPDSFEHYLLWHGTSLAHFVYQIVGEDSWKKAGL